MAAGVFALALTFALIGGRAAAQHAAIRNPPAKDITQLRIDPLLLVTVKEFRNVIGAIGDEIYPGWYAQSIPMLLYRPLVQEVLLGAREAPAGFGRYTGPSVLGGETIYARNDTTVITIDDQNTTIELDSARVLVVADRFSRERNQLGGAFAMQPADRAKWLEEWNFIQSPYDELTLMMHEAFHVHQERLAPDKRADEDAILQYPLLEANNNALVALEGMLLRDALLATDSVDRIRRIEEFVAVRSTRHQGLDSVAVAYENLVEYSEGTAKYVEYRFLQQGERVSPVPEMYLYAGFKGYRDVLRAELHRRADDMARIAANSDDRFGNRFGAGPLRFRLYGTGGAQGVLLDYVMPGWKQRIFHPGVYLTTLLEEAVPLTRARRATLVERAQGSFGYDSILANRVGFEAEGRRRIAAKLQAILGDTGTIVTIRYDTAGAALRMAYTPFGVTAVSAHAAIYELVPIAIRFPNDVVLRMKSAAPVLVDRGAGTVSFAVGSDPGLFTQAASGLDLPELTLAPSARTIVAAHGSRVTIELH
jgi:hypothetical protein